MRKNPHSVILTMLGLLVCSAALWLWWGGRALQDTGTVNPDETQEVPLRTEAAGITQGKKGGEPWKEEIAANPEGSRTLASPDKEFIIRGRCVDSEGHPVQGVKATLNAYARSQAQELIYEKKFGKVTWKNPVPLITGKDGRFDFRVPSANAPPPIYGVSLSLRAADFVYVLSRLRSSQDRSDHDLGDITLKRGGKIRGRVVDNQGKIRPGLKVRVNLSQGSSRLDSEFRSATSASVLSQADGGFAFPRPLSYGLWNLSINAQLLSPKTVTLKVGNSDPFVDIVVRSESEIETILGSVVDELGNPISGAHLSTDNLGNLGDRRGRSQKDGTFKIQRWPSDHGHPLSLWVERVGFELLHPDRTFAWQSSGHRLVLIRGKTLVLEVRDAHTSETIEDYSMDLNRIDPTPDGGTWIHRSGRHKAGRLILEGIRQGRYRILIHPQPRHARSKPIYVDIEEKPVTVVPIAMSRLVSQEIEVIRMDGSPVTEVLIELVEPRHGLPADGTTFIAEPKSRTSTTARNQADLWSRGKTNKLGRLEVSGPPDRELSLRILGPGHVPQYLQGIRLRENAAAIQVRVKSGATVQGSITPLALIGQLGQLVDELTSIHKLWGKKRIRKAAVRLYREDPKSYFPSGDLEGFEISEDGSFQIEHIPPGSWRLQLIWARGFRLGHGSSMSPQSRFLTDLVGLKDGEVRKIKLHVPELLLGTTSGSVTWNGRSLSGGVLTLVKEESGSKPGRTVLRYFKSHIDDQGRFDLLLPSGIYKCLIRPKDDENGMFLDYPTPDTLVVVSGGKSRASIDLKTRVVRLRVHDSDGKPLPNVKIQAQHTSSQMPASIVTDDSGEIRMRAPTGIFALSILPNSLSTPQAIAEFRSTHKKDFTEVLRAKHLTLDRIEVAPGTQPQVIDVEVPLSAGY